MVQKSHKPFCSLGIDHAHEQNNAIIKAEGGAIGLTQDPSALRRWTIGGPEVARLLKEFQKESVEEDGPTTHHEEYGSFQKKFLNKCAALKDSFLQHENPFTMKENLLITLDTRTVVDQKGIDNLDSLENTGISLYKQFVDERFIRKTKLVTDPLKKIN